jgi:hypothetical protein
MRYAAGFISAFYNPLKNPNAPTIGTATAGNASASVTFTAPSDIGGSAITGYTVVSTPSGFTGTAASSPVTVSGLTNGTAYTFTVFATNSYGPSVLSAASNSVTPSSLPAIGSAYQGGYFAGQISTTANGVATHNLVVGPKASAQASLSWKNANTATTGADSAIDGPQNTADMVADGNSTVYPSAHFCNDLVTGGYSDWYMPARNEIEVCYFFLKPTTTANNTDWGSNANAVSPEPISTNHTSGNPAQTSAAIFQSGGSEAFTPESYWSSTEASNTQAFTQQFSYGSSGQNNKNYTYASFRVRAIRRVAV